MGKFSYTDGTIVYTIDNCKCGLTAGCPNCQPIIISPLEEMNNVVVYYTKPRYIQHGLIRIEEIYGYLPIYLEAFW